MINGAQMLKILPAVSSWVCALVVICPAVAAAQTSNPRSIELFGGYSYLRDPGSSILAATSGDDNFSGWSAGIGLPIWHEIAAIAEVAGHYKTRTTFDDRVHLSMHSYLGGPRATIEIGRFAEFIQVLGGVVHARGSAFGVTVANTRLSIQPGGGFDIRLNRRFAARLELDYRWIKESQGGDTANQFRAVGALVYR
jgi:hypothetical protein